MFRPNHFPQLVNTSYYKIISQVNGKFVTYTPYNKLTGFGKVYVGIGSLVGIINLLITPVGNDLTKLGCRDKGTENLVGVTFFNPENYHRESHTSA